MINPSSVQTVNTTTTTSPPATSGSTSNGTTNAQAQQTLNTNYSDFLRLLTTQLQNQDPTNPTDTSQLTQQIASLSQVEQQINTNNELAQLITVFQSSQTNSMVNYIGKQIEATGNQGYLQNGHAPFAYYLGQDAGQVTYTIKDATGNTVYTGAGPTTAGRNEIVWNGKDNDGKAMPEGTYTITLDAVDGSKNPIASQTYTTGIVSSIDIVNNVVYASIGNLSVPLSSIQSVRAPLPNA